MVLNLSLDECIDNTHTFGKRREKETEKKQIKKKTPTSDGKPRKAKSEIT
jgi:hypothetical protein